ncbi:hypothetical protein GKQ23_15815 [Erwinia sp. E602]|uniref:hypothetical protein n=1 Tax=Erwinia sp. E602 TaxID=2675378 RepID=UPI001BAA96E0|nr:hypothetical protein [Erwinia sp. E602]QUG76379.1 hypothetical protein GKQ23_15815 [Erwinia sp. E602]
MAITSLFINGTLPVIPGMKKLSDFEMPDIFEGLPLPAVNWRAGYFFGPKNPQMAANLLFPEHSGEAFNSPVRSDFGATFNAQSYIDTAIKLPAYVSVAGVIRRPPVSTETTFILTDFTGTAAAGNGLAVAVRSSGKLALYHQNGEAAPLLTEVDFPASVKVGDKAGFTVSVKDKVLIIAMYDPETETLNVKNAATTYARMESVRSALIGAKYSNNTATSVEVRALLVAEGDIGVTSGQADHITLLKYLLSL